ncbi:MAG: N-acetylmuramidase family protein [Hyphomonadaceae bacterium]|nr:N-acetylmuramidase family protein [Hyphomonadaceae bacterium]
MSILDTIFRVLFGRQQAPPPPPPPRSPPPPPPRPTPPAPPTAPPPAPPTAPPPAPPTAPPPAPPIAPPPAPPVAPPPPATGFLDGLRAQTRDPIGRADFQAVAARFNCEWEAVGAVAQVESGALGAFGPDGRMIILFEPHIFSRLTNSQFDASNPTVSYPRFGTRPYPRTQGERWAQLAEAFALNEEAALKAASYGKFQILGQNHAVCGFPNARAFVADMAQSEARQLAAFENFVRGNNLADELQRLDWRGFARGYNGPAYEQTGYHTKMQQAYDRLKAGGAMA